MQKDALKMQKKKKRKNKNDSNKETLVAVLDYQQIQMIKEKINGR